MFRKKEWIAMLLAGGQGSRLYALTRNLAKPAVPFGGKYRIIDFPLSNCVNSGIDTVGVLTQYQPLVLNDYLGNGEPWDLDRSYGGVHILPPYMCCPLIKRALGRIGTGVPPTPFTRISTSSTGTSRNMWPSSRATTSIRWITPKCCGSTRRKGLTAP